MRQVVLEGKGLCGVVGGSGGGEGTWRVKNSGVGGGGLCWGGCHMFGDLEER